jgi:hypothetical protein
MHKRFHKKVVGKKGKALGETKMVNPEKRLFSRDQMPFPSVYSTRMKCAFIGTLPASTASSGYACVSGNSMHTPFNSTLVAANRSVNYYSATGYSSESYSTVQPAGFTSICGVSQCYQNYRVLGSQIKVSFKPTSTSDNILVCVNAGTTGTNIVTTVWTADDAPYSTGVKSFTSIEQRGFCIKSLKTGKIWGVSKEAVRDSPQYSAAYNGSPTNEWTWVINWQVVDNTTTNAIMGLQIEVIYDVEFFNALTGGLPDTLQNKVIEEPDSPEAYDLVVKGKCYKEVVPSGSKSEAK